MSREELDPALCESCCRPLFLDKEECRGFIEERLRKGFIVCSCCGSELRRSRRNPHVSHILSSA